MSYEYSYTVDESMGIGFAIFWLLYMLVMLGLSIALYVLRASGMHAIARRRGIRKPWLSWIPVADNWLLGCISDQYQYVVKGRNKSKRKVMLTLSIVNAVLGLVMVVCYVVMIVNSVTGAMGGVSEDEMMMGLMGPMMGILGICIPVMGVSIALMVFRYMALYDLYTSCTPQNNVLFLVLSIIFNVTEPFFIFFSRKKDGGMPPRRPEPTAYIPAEPVSEPASETPHYIPRKEEE